MKLINAKFKILLLVSIFGLISCENNDDESLPDPIYNAPIISIQDGTTLELSIGQSIIFNNISITGSVGITDFRVLIDGEVIQSESFDGTTGQLTSSFQFQVPGEWIDTTRLLQFEAVDKLDQVTQANVEVVVGTVTPQYTIEDVVINNQAFKRITGTININETLDNSALWIIADSVQVAQQIKLTITEGTQIFAEPGPTILYVNQLAEVDWQGTATNPIIFNSFANAPGQPGDDTPGQWEGIRIDGDGAGSNSGIIRYVRQMYGGFGDDGQNSFRFQDVGLGTTVEYIQVYRSASRAVRLNGGDVGLKYIISTNGVGTGFRMDDDWNGFGQFWVVNNSIEGGSFVEGREGTPILSNITITGVGFNNEGVEPSGNGYRLRNGGNAQIYKSVAVGVGRSVRFDAGSEQGVGNGISFFRDSASFGNSDDNGTGFDSSAAFFNPTSPDYVPTFNNTVEPFLIEDSYVGVGPLNLDLAEPLLNPFFDDTDYIGAVQAGNDWTVGWCLNLDGSLRQ